MGEVVGDVIVKKNGYRLVLLPLPLQGHMNSMLQLAQILFSQGFSITILHTTFNSPSPSNFPHFTFHSISDHLLESDTSTSDIIELLSILNIKCVEPIRECLSSLLLVPPSNSSVHVSRDRDQIACLITDSVWYCTAEIAKEFRIARVELRTTSISSFRAFSALLDLREKKACNFSMQPLQEEKLLQDHPLKEIWPLTLKDLPYLETKNPTDFYELLENMIKSMKAASGVVVNSFEELETGHLTYYNGTHVPVPVFPIGPFHKHFPSTSSSFLEHDRSSIDWLDKQDEKSVLYVSFGSIASMSQSQFQDIASALADSGSPFLWVVRSSGGLHGSVPDGLMDSLTRIGRIVTWAPQAEVLAHRAIAGFWTHCGWNSTLESVCEGVPMICSPFFGDQKVNACYISKVWKVGLYLEIGEGKGEMKSAIISLMVGEEGERMRERMTKLRDQVELCYKPGGSSYKALQSLTNLLVSVDATTDENS